MTDVLGDDKERLLKFARWVIKECCWHRGALDGGDVQEKAYELGLLVAVPFDPEKHDGDGAEFCEPGDDWYEFSDLLKETR